MKLKNLLFIVVLMGIMTACAGAEVDPGNLPDETEPADTKPTETVPAAPAPGARIGEDFKLNEGDSIWIEKDLFEITVVSVIEDSRCPADVQCFWEGNAKVEVLVNDQTYILTLGTLLEGDQNPVDLGDGLFLRLLRVDPYPGRGDNDQPYTIIMTVERATSQPYQYPDAV